MSAPVKQIRESDSLRLMPSLREKAEKLAVEDGVSLDEFVNVAVAERIAAHEQMQWLKRRLSAVKAPSETTVSDALGILHRAGSHPPEPGDELPEGYVRPTTV